jgi:S-methyl-5-thioribose-1-phosphate isomerase
MRVNKREYRTIWMEGHTVYMIDQNSLPFRFKIIKSSDYRQMCQAIRIMTVRGAGAIGAAAGFAMALAFHEAAQSKNEDMPLSARKEIETTRPTARNLFYATQRVYDAGLVSPQQASKEALKVADENAEEGRKIGEHGQELIADGCRIETHCNAGWLGFVDYGTALSPVYLAHRAGKKVFVYVDETRPRGQGAKLTAWELKNEGVPHCIIADNAGAYLMSKGMIDMVLVGADRIAANGDVANKIGTLGKAIAAKEFHVPFYVAAPSSTFDMNCRSGSDIQIEERNHDEVLFQEGLTDQGKIVRVRISAPGSDAINPAFDITPAGYITGLITEKGIIKPTEKEIHSLFLYAASNNLELP